MPVELNSAFAGLPDAASGLVHMGGGRWFDPAIGRALQPNPTGGAPTAPQTMSRYAATSFGQPGVAQAAAGSGFNAIPSVISFVYGTATELAGNTRKLVGYNFTGSATISVSASKSALTRNWRNVPKNYASEFGGIAGGFEDGGRSFFTRTSGAIPLAGNSIDDLSKASDDIVKGLESVLPSKGPWAARVTSQLNDVAGGPQYILLKDLDNWDGAVRGVGAGIDFVVGFGFQLANDSSNPYLSSNQIAARAIASGSLGAGSSYIFGGIGAFLCGLPCAVFGAIGGGVLWSEVGQPFVFESSWSPLRTQDRNILPFR